MTTPLLGQFVVCRLGLAMINPHTKFEVSTFIHYKDMKLQQLHYNPFTALWILFGITGYERQRKMQKLEWFGRLGVPKVTGNVII